MVSIPVNVAIYAVLATIAISVLVQYLVSKPSSKRLAPGPRPWPIIGNLPHMGLKPHGALAALAKTYGPFMHLQLGSVDVVVASSASVVSQLLKDYDANFSNRPATLGAKCMTYDCQDMVYAPYGPRWRMLRKLCHIHLFSHKALDDFSHVRQSEVSMLTGKLASADEAPTLISRPINICITNALARALLGKRVFRDESSAESSSSDEFKEMVLEIMRVAGVFDVRDFIPQLKWLDVQGVGRGTKRLHKRFDRFVEAFLVERKASDRDEGGDGGGKVKDLLSVFLQDDADGEGGKLTDAEIKALLFDMFTAGTDTTTSTVEWAMAELIRQQELMSQAQKELDSFVGRERLVKESDLPQLPLLRAIVKETFRLHPSTPLSLPRVAAESCEIDGYHVPKDATVLVNVWAIGRDSAHWEDPLEFRPARFMDEENIMDLNGTDFKVIPFGAGRRMCPGMSWGLRMVELLTATLVHGFDWKLPADQTAEKLDMEEAYGVTLQRMVPLVLHPNARLASKAYEPI